MSRCSRCEKPSKVGFFAFLTLISRANARPVCFFIATTSSGGRENRIVGQPGLKLGSVAISRHPKPHEEPLSAGASVLLFVKEHEGADAYIAGPSYREIADTSNRSPLPARMHIRTIYAKLGVSTKMALAKRLGHQEASVGAP